MAVIGALVIACQAPGDVVTLKDGRTFEGIVVLDSPSKVTIETMIGKFKTKMTFKRHEIASVERKDLPDDFFDPGASKKKKTPAKTAESGKRRAERKTVNKTTRFVAIPIRGTIGVEVQAEGVERALNTAIKRGVRHAVFVIDSPGGYVAEAEAIAAVIEAKRDQINCYAVIESAISAAIWVAISCDRVFISPWSEIGGAVVYSKDQTTGAAEVDAKMNSIIAADLAARAQRSGIKGDAVRAMVIPEAEYFVWMDDDGETLHGVKAPENLPAERLIIADGADTVLTLTGEQALAAELADEFPGDLKSLGAHVGAEGWESAGNIGKSAMAAAHRAHQQQSKKRKDLIEDITTAFEELSSMQDKAIAAHPNNFTYVYDLASNLLVPASQAAWRENTDKCIGKWRRLLAQTERIERMQQRAVKLGMERSVEHKELKKYYDACQDALVELEKNRNRRYVNR